MSNTVKRVLLMCVLVVTYTFLPDWLKGPMFGLVAGAVPWAFWSEP